MCTSIILFRKNHSWPIIFASNRDEFFSRKSLSPAKHWKNHRNITGGLDKKMGGTWCAINDYGVIGCIHNRNFNIKNFKAKKTRGEIILKCLKAKNSLDSINILKKIDIRVYDGFNLIIADNKNCFLIKNTSFTKKLIFNTIPEGLSLITNKNRNDPNNQKCQYYLKKFKNIYPPEPEKNFWSSWKKIIISKSSTTQLRNQELICFNIKNNSTYKNVFF